MTRIYSNRTNGKAGARASRYSRQVSTTLRRLGYRPNTSYSVLNGLTCRQVGEEVSVRVGYYPGEGQAREEAVAFAAKLADILASLGYEARQGVVGGEPTNTVWVRREGWR